jgi:class 3 adenylate cyclase/type II secretory pathway predicted ATPase ExeA/tetratricopeptide (TPR) repeat protein
MQVCPSCGEENPAKFRLCGYCGAALAPALPPQEERKVVTVFFSDLKGSTNLGEQLDPESLREVMTRYFDAVTAVLRRHGGTIEKFIGDAIMAVFGLPKLHEDDALRAVRAAHETQRALAELNEELLRGYGVTLTNRTGVNTGEVVTGDATTAQRLVTGDTVNVAARLEQAAGANEVLIGDLTYRLTRESIVAESVEPLALKGKAERVPAYRLVDVPRAAEHDDTSGNATLVGRVSELAALSSSFRQAVDERTCRLAMVIGEAGVGKSTLVRALVGSVEREAVILRGRCLPYGDGITFWPLVEAISSAARIAADDSPDVANGKLRQLVGDDDVAVRIGSAIGLSDEQYPVAEVFWAVRRLLETLGANRPVVFVVDDVQSAEPTFMDLLAHLVSSTDAPVQLLLTARLDLLEAMPDWATAETVTRIVLGPLDATDAEAMVANLLGGAILDPHTIERIVTAAEGNPLFVEQLVSMLIEDGALRQVDGGWALADPNGDLTIPPTIHALLASRLDHLAREERVTIDPAAVIGLYFPEPAVAELAPDAVRPAVRANLEAMTRKHLLRLSDHAGNDDYRFDHILIRDAAYGSMLKRARATYHERFVEWADRVNAERDRAAEYEEISGYHLEQAYRYLGELGPISDHARDVGREASRRLAAAGRRASSRGDIPAAVNLLRRAADTLDAESPEQLALLPDLGEALTEHGDFGDAASVLDRAIAAAGVTGDQRLAAHARLMRLYVAMYEGATAEWTAEVALATEQAEPILIAANDHAGLARVYRLRFLAHATHGRYGLAAADAERIGEHARLAGDRRQERRAWSNYAQVALHGPVPVDEATGRIEQMLDRLSGDRGSEATIRGALGRLYAMRGNFDLAREQYRASRAAFEELGRTVTAASTSLDAAPVELLAGDAELAAELLLADYNALGSMGERFVLSTVAGVLSQVSYQLDRTDAAESYALVCRELAADDDVASQTLWRGTRAKLLASRGLTDEAILLAREALSLAADTEAPIMQAETRVELAATLSIAGRADEAHEHLAAAIALYDAKGDRVSAGRLREQVGVGD